MKKSSSHLSGKGKQELFQLYSHNKKFQNVKLSMVRVNGIANRI